MAWSPDGQRLASCGDARTARIWTADGRPVAVLEGHDAEVATLAWSPDGRTVATGGNDGTARLWTVPDGRAGPVIHRGDAAVRAIAWSQGGQGGMLAVGLAAGGVRLYDPDGTAYPSLSVGDGVVCALAWRDDGRRLAAGCALGPCCCGTSTHMAMRPPDLSSPRRGHMSTRSPGYPTGVLSRRRAGSGILRVWKPDGTLDRTLGPGPADRPQRLGILSLAWSPDGDRIAIGAEDFSIRLWDRDGSAGPKVVRGGPMEGIAWDPSGTRFAAVCSWGP